jgi:hypothetical protein
MFTLPSAERESQVRVNRRRWESTPGFTELIADFTATTSESEASGPTSRRLIAAVGGFTRKQTGDNNMQMCLNHPRTGLVANPAQITRPLRFGWPLAAHCIAKGAEKDSANRTNGVEAGKADQKAEVVPRMTERSPSGIGPRSLQCWRAKPQ